MPRYYFNIKDGHRFVDPSGLAFKNDHDAIERAKVIAIGVSIDKPETDPTRHISVLNEARVEIFKVLWSNPRRTIGSGCFRRQRMPASLPERRTSRSVR